MDIVQKLRDVANTKDVDILAKHLVCEEAAAEIERLREALGTIANGIPGACLFATEVLGGMPGIVVTQYTAEEVTPKPGDGDVVRLDPK